MAELIEIENETGFETPILFILFNRPEHARRVLNQLRRIKPHRLFVAIDGPRPGSIDDFEGTKQCEKMLNEIDWECEVSRLIRPHNLGCKNAVSSAINWFFDHVEQGIILEDDCLPDPTFFSFCQALLEKYAENQNVMHIGGVNLYGNRAWGEATYFFSKIPHIWGWATWRRAWKLYDVAMQDYPAFKDGGGIDNAVTYPPSRLFWQNEFDNTYAGLINTWDYQWVFTIWKYEGLCIIPNQNLITNIGFGEAATHTVSDSEFANLPTKPINTRTMVHPTSIDVNSKAVQYAFVNFYQLPSWWQRKATSLRKRLNRYKL